jgi:lipopolysaccharide exporter
MNLKSSFIQGAAWAIAMRWSIKLLGLGSTVILARILSPGDYGIVAMAMLIVGMLEVLVDFGAETNVLREQTLTRDIIDSAWSLQIIQGSLLSLLLALVAPFAGTYFHEQRVIGVIWIIACGVLLRSFSNVGMIVARKEFQFGLEFRFKVISKVIGVAVTIIAAFIIKDYRALVWGIMANYMSPLVLSYLMHPYRPSWNVTRLRSMWHFSKWLLFSGIGNYATQKVDELIAGHIGDAHSLGVYSMASELGQLPTAEMGPPIMRAFLPTLSTIKDNTERVRSVVLKTLGAVNTLTFAAACGFALVSEPLTHVLLGDKWAAVAPFLVIFAIVGALKVAVAPFAGYFLLLGHSKLQAYIMWAEFLVFAVAAVLLVPQSGIFGLAYARLVSAIVYFVSNVVAAKAYAGIDYRSTWNALFRPTISTLMMTGALLFLSNVNPNSYIELSLKITTGVLVYTASILATWMLSGRPDGIELIVMRKLRLARKAAN